MKDLLVRNAVLLLLVTLVLTSGIFVFFKWSRATLTKSKYASGIIALLGIILALASLWQQQLFSRQIQVFGVVVDSTGKPVPGADIKTRSAEDFQNTWLATTTDDFGVFRIRAKPKEYVDIQVDKPGFTSSTVSVVPKPDAPLKFVINQPGVPSSHKSSSDN